MESKRNGKVNFAELARRYNCDYRTVKRYINARDENPTKRKPRKILKITNGFEQIIEEKYLNFGAPSIAIYNLLKENYGYKGSYTSIKY